MKKLALVSVIILSSSGCTAFMHGYNKASLNQALSLCWNNQDKAAAMECHIKKHHESGINVVPQTNALAVWGSGFNERLLVSKSHRTITAVSPSTNSLTTFTIEDNTTDNDCVNYKANRNVIMKLCFGSDATIYVNNTPTNAGTIEMDDGSMLSAKATREYRALTSARINEVNSKNDLQKFQLEQEKRRIEAETKVIEKSDDSVDAVNDAIKSIGKGIENHGLN
ncbi:MAG: hypothetical protein ACRCWP_09015 [Shewanella sp.]